MLSRNSNSNLVSPVSEANFGSLDVLSSNTEQVHNHMISPKPRSIRVVLESKNKTELPSIDLRSEKYQESRFPSQNDLEETGSV